MFAFVGASELGIVCGCGLSRVSVGIGGGVSLSVPVREYCAVSGSGSGIGRDIGFVEHDPMDVEFGFRDVFDRVLASDVAHG